MKKILASRTILYIAFVLLLFACQPVSIPFADSLTASEESPELAQEVSQLATQTAIAAITPSISPGDMATSTPTLHSVIALPEDPAITPTLEVSGPFRQVSANDAMIAGRVTGMHADPDGSLWLLSEDGISQYEAGDWMGVLTRQLGELVGMDNNGRFWVASQDGASITSWDRVSWITYTLDAGWTPILSSFRSPVRGGITSDQFGYVWLTTDQDVRMFDGSAWQVYNDEDMGMSPPGMEDLFKSYWVEHIAATGEVWVGRCDWGGPGPFGGGGVRKFDGQSWETAGSQVDAGCVTVIREGPSGNVWVGHENGLLRYNSSEKDWVEFPLPEPPEESGVRYGFFINITIDAEGNPWPELELCGGASCYNGEVLFQLQDGEWRQIGEVSEGLSRDLLFDESGTPWLITGGAIYQVVDASPEYVTELNVLSATTDRAGQIWLLAQGRGAPSLWRLENN